MLLRIAVDTKISGCACCPKPGLPPPSCWRGSPVCAIREKGVSSLIRPRQATASQAPQGIPRPLALKPTSRQAQAITPPPSPEALHCRNTDSLYISINVQTYPSSLLSQTTNPRPQALKPETPNPKSLNQTTHYTKTIPWTTLSAVWAPGLPQGISEALV